MGGGGGSIAGEVGVDPSFVLTGDKPPPLLFGNGDTNTTDDDDDDGTTSSLCRPKTANPLVFFAAAAAVGPWVAGEHAGTQRMREVGEEK